MGHREWNEQAKIALDALRFFASEGDLQLAIAEQAASKGTPAFFGQGDEGCGIEDYLVGVACIFSTYLGALLDQVLGERANDAFEDFSHRLLVLMGEGRVEAWDRSAVVGGGVWVRLRKEALRALEELGLEFADDERVVEFKIDDLIDPDEFRTTPDAKRLLD